MGHYGFKPGHVPTVDELAEALYEGSHQISNLAEEMARRHGKAQALSFYPLMGSNVQNFWKSIAAQIIAHSKHWLPNEGSGCVLDRQEADRLSKLPRIKG
jgi:hypothetical protein